MSLEARHIEDEIYLKGSLNGYSLCSSRQIRAEPRKCSSIQTQL